MIATADIRRRTRNRPPVRVMVLPNGQRVTLGEFVRSWRALLRVSPDTEIAKWQWFPVTAREVLADIRYGVTDRINKRGGLVLRDMDTPARQARFFRRAVARANVHCNNCHGPATFNNCKHRFCSDNCARDYWN